MPPEKPEEHPLPKEIQLLPREELERRKESALKYQKIFLVTGGILLIAQIVALSFSFIRYQLEEDLNESSDELQETIGDLVVSTQVENQLRTLGKNIDLINKLRDESVVTPQLLDIIEESIPVDVILNDLQLGEVVVIKGTSNNYLSVHYFLKHLKEYDEVKSSTLTSVVREEPGDPITFTINLVLVEVVN